MPANLKNSRRDVARSVLGITDLSSPISSSSFASLMIDRAGNVNPWRLHDRRTLYPAPGAEGSRKCPRAGLTSFILSAPLRRRKSAKTLSHCADSRTQHLLEYPRSIDENTDEVSFESF